MNVVSVLFVTLMVAIAMEKCLNNYILVKIRDGKGISECKNKQKL